MGAPAARAPGHGATRVARRFPCVSLVPIGANKSTWEHAPEGCCAGHAAESGRSGCRPRGYRARRRARAVKAATSASFAAPIAMGDAGSPCDMPARPRAGPRGAGRHRSRARCRNGLLRESASRHITPTLRTGMGPAWARGSILAFRRGLHGLSSVAGHSATPFPTHWAMEAFYDGLRGRLSEGREQLPPTGRAWPSSLAAPPASRPSRASRLGARRGASCPHLRRRTRRWCAPGRHHGWLP